MNYQPKTISIIGGRGKMGSLFAEAFRLFDYTVLVSDKENTNNLELAKHGDIVIVSVPLEKTEQVIEEIGPYVRKEALLTDFTSVKMKPVAAMLKYSQAEVIGGHPLFGPSIDLLKGQNMILCPERGEKYLSWYTNALDSLGVKVTLMNAEEHDKTMAVVQCLTHFSNIAFAYAISKMAPNIQPEATTPAFILRLYATKRMLTPDPSWYSRILHENPFGEEAVRAYVDTVAEVSAMAQKNTKTELEELLLSLQKDFESHPALQGKKVKISDE